jgi:hypothetical protein
MMYVASGVLAKYLVYLAASGSIEKAAEALRELGWLLSYRSDAHIATLYMLRLLGVVAEAPDTGELLKALERYAHPLLKPALAASLGAPPKPIDVASMCAEAAEVTPDLYKRVIETTEGDVDLSQLGEYARPFAFCLDAYKAVTGDMEALNRIRERVKEWLMEGSELLSVLDRLDAVGLVQVLAPIRSRGRLILLLRTLDEARGAEGAERERLLELARTHALAGKYEYRGTIGETLFGWVADAVKKCGGYTNNCEDLKLALLKLYYLHI